MRLFLLSTCCLFWICERTKDISNCFCCKATNDIKDAKASIARAKGKYIKQFKLIATCVHILLKAENAYIGPKAKGENDSKKIKQKMKTESDDNNEQDSDSDQKKKKKAKKV